MGTGDQGWAQETRNWGNSWEKKACNFVTKPVLQIIAALWPNIFVWTDISWDAKDKRKSETLRKNSMLIFVSILENSRP